MNADTVFDDLAAEHAQLDALLSALRPEDWSRPSAAEGWTVSDVVLHLAQSEELVFLTVSGDQSVFVRPDGLSMDELVDRAVAEDRGVSYDQVLDRWRRAGAASVEALRGCPPKQRLAWAAWPLSPRTLATTRIAEHWAHAHDIADPLQLDDPDTSRLRHIAWLAHRTLPYAFSVNGLTEPGPIRAELTGPDGDLWTFGAPGAPSRITGPAGEFCRVGARRLAPEKTSLTTNGPDAAIALTVLRNYAV